MTTETGSTVREMSIRLARSGGRAARDRMANARVTEEELRELEQESSGRGLSLSEWAREVLLRAARKQEVDPVFTEVIAMRVLLNTVLSKLACGEVMTQETFNAQMTTIRTTKHTTAGEVMQQYAARTKR